MEEGRDAGPETTLILAFELQRATDPLFEALPLQVEAIREYSDTSMAYTKIVRVLRHSALGSAVL